MSRDIARIREIAGNIRPILRPTAYALDAIADRLTIEAAEITERLTRAGIQAAEARHLADELRKQLAVDAEKAAAAKTHLKRAADEAVRLSGELARDLLVAKNNNNVALRTIAFLLDELNAPDAADEPLDVRFQFTEQPGGLTPSEASDLALSLGNLSEGNDPEAA
jgi:hypothetical protein